MTLGDSFKILEVLVDKRNVFQQSLDSLDQVLILMFFCEPSIVLHNLLFFIKSIFVFKARICF